MFQWDNILCSDTLNQKEKMPSSWVDYPMDPFEQDYREIVSSLSFRHLQDKAQVYQLGKGDYVRTRLTHSLEVSTVAKQLGIMMIFNEKWNYIPAFKDLGVDYARAIPTVLACSGLLHDMGNPPFGHEGEYAIGSWFEEHLADDGFEFFGKPIRDIFSKQMCMDLCNFEGNAQVIRLLSRSRFPSEDQEANVTFATLSTLIKYPVSSVGMDKNSPDHRITKFGYFYSEQKLVEEIRKKTGIIKDVEDNARNPLTYLLEAADDIAYVASDIEDAVSKNTITVQQLISFMRKAISELPDDGNETLQMQKLTFEGIVNNLSMRIENCDGSENEVIAVFHKWTNYLRNWLMYVAAISFVNNSEAIMNGTFKGELLDDSFHKFTVSILKKEMRENVYTRLGDIHVAAFGIIKDLMSRFADAVIYWDTETKLNQEKAAYIDLIPERLKKAYLSEKGDDEAMNLYLRFRMVTDFISGMTDGFALDLYKKMNALSY